MSNYLFETSGVCSQAISFSIQGDSIANIQILGGCNGNLKAVSRLVESMPASKAVSIMKGITCGDKATSCPDQLANAIELAIRAEKTKALKNSVFDV
ncbi:MAG: TIGR03905 family TSCPD domain-containing protein [Eubacteriaceae bacterium]|nr:TIGR03905 family TSCPD domain-containing protein [Eubacteriaceae bacterium]